MNTEILEYLITEMKIARAEWKAEIKRSNGYGSAINAPLDKYITMKKLVLGAKKLMGETI